MDTNGEFHPELIPRRGEWTAWILALIATATWLLLRWRAVNVPGAVLIFVSFLLFSALSISLGNWMDRQTSLSLTNTEISFRNGLRNVSLKWDEIREVRVLQARWGKRVQIVGQESHFEFRTLGEVEVRGELKGRMGFKEGEELLEQIIRSGRLERSDQSDKEIYYAQL